MGDRADTLANRYEQLNQDLIALLESCSPEQWRAVCTNETWPVGVTAHHVAVMANVNVDVLSGAARGEPWPAIGMDVVDQGNADHAREHANCTKAETIDLLRRTGTAVSTLVRRFDDEQLDRAWPALWRGNALLSVAQCVEGHLIDHIRGHLASIRGAIGDE